MSRRLRRHIRRRFLAMTGIFLVSINIPFNGCWDSELAKRFREGFAPGFIEGLSQAAIDGGPNSEPGLRRAFAAIFEGLGALLNTADGTGSSSGS